MMTSAPKAAALLLLLACLTAPTLSVCIGEVYAVLAGYPTTYSTRHENEDCKIFRLDNDLSSWCPALDNPHQWVQISSLVPERWVGVVTQGKPTHDNYITEYRVSYTMNGRDWTFVDEGRLFNGNYDRNTKVRNDFDRPVLARAIRILPTKWFGALRMRFDVIF
jgi:hypothetical protein